MHECTLQSDFAHLHRSSLINNNQTWQQLLQAYLSVLLLNLQMKCLGRRRRRGICSENGGVLDLRSGISIEKRYVESVFSFFPAQQKFNTWQKHYTQPIFAPTYRPRRLITTETGHSANEATNGWTECLQPCCVTYPTVNLQGHIYLNDVDCNRERIGGIHATSYT